MKKMFTIAALVACAVAVQAAQISWSASMVTTDGTTKIGKANLVGYLFDAATSQTDALAAINAGGDTLASLQVGNAGAGTADGVIGAGAYTTDAYATSSSQSFYAIIIDSSSNKYIATDNKTVTIKPTGITSVGFASQANKTNWQPVGVPEPCTVALVALGLAAFGLKRKVA